jgi:kynurenine formamidase
VRNNEKQAMQNKVIDLTRLLNEKITVYPDTVAPKFEVLNTVEKDGFTEIKMTMASHTGTHIDAPCHILQGAKSLDLFPMDKFFGKAMIIPCQGKNEISLEYLQTFEDKIAKVDFILFFTGWQYKWNTKDYFDDCPTLTRDAAKWLTKFKLKGIGIDAFSLDKIISAPKVTSENLPNHHILLGKEILLIENLTNLDKLPDCAFSFQCLPLNIENADGSPVRAIAMMNESRV